ncbi:MAG: hypothetical protein LBJ59_09605 [Zoogloeaceae bacterium]|nr:hypothetical protein [Zoogloeaceae bacterium]
MTVVCAIFAPEARHVVHSEAGKILARTGACSGGVAEYRTFLRKADALAWAAARETDIRATGGAGFNMTSCASRVKLVRPKAGLYWVLMAANQRVTLPPPEIRSDSCMSRINGT